MIVSMAAIATTTTITATTTINDDR
jgi:hypothetical protein